MARLCPKDMYFSSPHKSRSAGEHLIKITVLVPRSPMQRCSQKRAACPPVPFASSLWTRVSCLVGCVWPVDYAFAVPDSYSISFHFTLCYFGPTSVGYSSFKNVMFSSLSFGVRTNQNGCICSKCKSKALNVTRYFTS